MLKNSILMIILVFCVYARAEDVSFPKYKVESKSAENLLKGSGLELRCIGFSVPVLAVKGDVITKTIRDSIKFREINTDSYNLSYWKMNSDMGLSSATLNGFDKFLNILSLMELKGIGALDRSQIAMLTSYFPERGASTVNIYFSKDKNFLVAVYDDNINEPYAIYNLDDGLVISSMIEIKKK